MTDIAPRPGAQPADSGSAICGFQFATCCCVAPAGHAGGHVTSNERFPHGLFMRPPSDAPPDRTEYEILRDAVIEHLPQFVHDDDVAEVAIIEDAIRKAGHALRSGSAPAPSEEKR